MSHQQQELQDYENGLFPHYLHTTDSIWNTFPYYLHSLPEKFLTILEDNSDIEERAFPADHLWDNYDTSIFHGQYIDDVIRTLHEGVTGDVVAADLFYVADDQTIRDYTLLLVQVQLQLQEKDAYVTVQLAPEFANALAISIYESTISIQDVRKDVDEDGGYRGGRDTPYSYVGARSHYLDDNM